MPNYVKGLEELNKNLAVLPDRMKKNVFRSVVRGEAREYIKISRENLGSGYQTLKKSLQIKAMRGRKIHLRVHPEKGRGAKNDGWYAHIVEFGSYQHPQGWDITPWKSKGGEGKKALSLGANVVYSKIRHPGIKPTRFMSRALNKESRIINGGLNAGKKAFDRQIKKSWLR